LKGTPHTERGTGKVNANMRAGELLSTQWMKERSIVPVKYAINLRKTIVKKRLEQELRR